MCILLNNNGYDNDSWQQALSQLLPDKPIHLFSELAQTDEVRASIEYAVVWNHPHGDLANYPNLRTILLLGAGTECLDDDPLLPNIPVARLVDPEVLKDMAMYTLHWVIHLHRKLNVYTGQQRKHQWLRHEVCQSQDFRICVFGLGPVGKKVCEVLANNGYQVAGWDRRVNDLPNVECVNDCNGLYEVLSRTNVMVNCLPLTPSTRKMINKTTRE